MKKHRLLAVKLFYPITFMIAASGILVTSVAQATLGEHDSHISGAESKLLKVRSQKAKKTETQTGTYTTNELTLDGTVVKEFSDSSGMVFAVSWHGMKTPDLSVIFGSYYTEYRNAREKMAVVKGMRAVNVKTSTVVVSSGGHMRNLHGFAYVPSLVPAGVQLESLN